MSIHVKSHRRGKSVVKAYNRVDRGFVVTSRGPSGRSIEPGIYSSLGAASIAKGRLRKGEAKGTIRKSVFSIKKLYAGTRSRHDR